MAEQQDVARAQVKLANVTEELLGETKTNNTVTTLHNKLTIWLTAAIVFLAVITLWTNYNKTGRYAISGGKGGVYVLDTKTSQLWQRATERTKNMGTNEKPMGEIISRRVETFEEIGTE